MTARGDVQVGDVIEVPVGTDFRGSAKYRFRVVSVSQWGATGVKVTIGGKTIRNRHDEEIETGMAWSDLPKVTVTKASTP